MSEDVFTFISVPERDAPYHKLFQVWLETNRDMIGSVARRIGTERIVVVDDVLEEGLSVMDSIADQIQEGS